MTTINNGELIKEVTEVADIQRENIPTTLGNSIIPVIDVNQKHSRVINISKNASNTTTGINNIYTTPTNKDFFLCFCRLTVNCDATCDNTYVQVMATLDDGSAVSLLDLRKPTTTSYQNHQTYNPYLPMKIKRGTAIYVQTSFTAGTCTSSTSFMGYTVESH